MLKSMFDFLRKYTDSPSILVAILKTVSGILFGLSFFSIPTFSSIGRFTIITWLLTIGTVVSMALVLLFSNKKIKVDFIALSFIAFGFFAFISSLLNGMRAFVFTPILLPILSCIIYIYCLNNKSSIKHLFALAYAGLIIFLLVFLFVYRYEIIHLQFSRLGSKFGDINDIALFMGLGTVLSLSFVFYSAKWYVRISSIFLFLAFVLCGFSSGSKSFVFILGICLLVQIFTFFGKKGWWIALLISIGIVALFIIVINLPFMSTFKERFLNMFKTLTRDERINAAGNDISTIDRLNMFVDGITMWLRKPVFGYGIQGFFRASSYGGKWSHNHFSETLASFGIIGAILFHYGYAKGVAGYFKVEKRNLEKSIGILLLFFIVTMFFVALNSQKLYAFMIPLPIALFANEKKAKETNSLTLIIEKKKLKKCLK